MLGDIMMYVLFSSLFLLASGHTEEEARLQEQKGNLCEIRRVTHEASVSCHPLTPGSWVLQ